MEAYPDPSGTGGWKTAALVNGVPTHKDGVALPALTALVYEAASATRVARPAGGSTTVAPLTPQDMEAIANLVVKKLSAKLA